MSPTVAHRKWLTRASATAGLVLILLVMGWLAPISPLGQAQSGSVRVEVLPKTVRLDPGEQATVLVVVRNKSSGRLESGTVVLLSRSGTATSPRKQSVGVLPAGTSRAMRVRVRRPVDAGPPEDVLIRLNYHLRPRRGAAVMSNVATSTLRVAARPPVKTLARAEVRSRLTNLQEFRQGDLLLLVRNLSPIDIDVQGITAELPSFLKLCMITPANSASKSGVTEKPCSDNSGRLQVPIRQRLKPQMVAVHRFEALAEDQVRPGPHVILFSVTVTSHEARRQTSSVIAQQDFTVSVLGESEITALLAIPSFLVLPGFLMLVMIRLLWEYVQPKTKPESLQFSQPLFWFLALTGSMIFPLIYPTTTALLLQQRREYLGGYGTRDLLYVWGLAIFAGFLVWVILRLAAQARQRWVTRMIPTREDTPEQLIERLGRRKLVAGLLERLGRRTRRQRGLNLPRVQFQSNGETAIGYLVYGRLTDEQLWVAPSIWFTFNPSATSEFTREFVTKVNANDAKAASRLIRQGERVGVLEVGWQKSDHLTEPRRIERITIKRDTHLTDLSIIQRKEEEA